MRFGAIHASAPDAVPHLRTRWRPDGAAPGLAAWFDLCPPDGLLLGNDRLGDCVPVADFRLIQIWRRIEGRAWRIPQQLVLARYADIAGYRPGYPETDTGTDTAADMLNWVAAPIVDETGRPWPIYWARLNPIDPHLAAALLCSPVLATLMLPAIAGDDLEAWGAPPGDGVAWEPQDGHRVVVGQIRDGWVRVRSWGQDAWVHPAFWARYAVGVDVPIPRKGGSAVDLLWAGLDFEALEGDLGQLVT